MRRIGVPYRVASAAFFGCATTACLVAGGPPAFEGPRVATCSQPPPEGKAARTTPELLALGRLHLEAALELQGSIYGDGGSLANAVDCFGRATRLAPDSYEASLMLGIANVTQARRAPPRSPTRASYLASAKQLLGQAYVLRQGPYEPLYYLAEIAVLEGQLDPAGEILRFLDQVGAKPGPVNALLGYLAEKAGNKEEAKRRFERALQAGWPLATMIHAAERVPDRAGGGGAL